MRLSSKRQRGEFAAVTLILLIGTVLRVGWPALTEFKADEARLFTLALEMAQDGTFALRGISSSVGIPNFPMSVWLYALPLLIWPHILSATLFTSLLNSAALGATWWFTRRYWGRDAALIALLLFAVNPWALHHARKIWAQNLLAPFVIGWAIAGALALVEGRSRWLVAHWLCLAIAIQTHLAAISLLPATVIWLGLAPRRVNWRWLLLAVAVSAATALPFAYYVATTGFPVVLGSGSATSGVAVTAGTTVGPQALRYAWLLFSGAEIHALAGAQAYRTFLATVPNGAPVYWLWGVLLLAGLFVLARTLRRRSNAQAQASALLLAWIACAALFFVVEVTPVALHYLLPLYPALFIAAGVGGAEGLQRLAASRQRGWRALAWGALAASAIVQIWIWGGLLAFVTTNATPGGFGTPLRNLLAVKAVVESQAASGGEVLIVGSGERTQVDNGPAIYDALLHGLPRRFVDAAQSALFPSGNAVVLLTETSAGDHSALYQQMAAGQSIAFRKGEQGVTVLTLTGQQPQPDRLLEPPPLLANWASFVGYASAESADGGVRWTLFWRPGSAVSADFHQFVHLLDENGRLVSQVDRPAFSAEQWRPDDLVVSVFRLPPFPNGTPTTVLTGMYTYPDITAIPILDVAANPAADVLTLPFSLTDAEPVE